MNGTSECVTCELRLLGLFEGNGEDEWERNEGKVMEDDRWRSLLRRSI